MISIRKLSLFEVLAKKSYLQLGEDEEDYYILAYCLNEVGEKGITLEEYVKALKCNKKVFLKEQAQIEQEVKCLMQTFPKGNEESNKNSNDVSILEIACSLVANGVNAEFVFDKMDIWQIKPLLDAMYTKEKKDLENTRFWNFLNLSPHIDTKKTKSPKDLVLFSWEEEEKRQKQKEQKEDLIARIEQINANKK